MPRSGCRVRPTAPRRRGTTARSAGTSGPRARSHRMGSGSRRRWSAERSTGGSGERFSCPESHRPGGPTANATEPSVLPGGRACRTRSGCGERPNAPRSARPRPRSCPDVGPAPGRVCASTLGRFAAPGMATVPRWMLRAALPARRCAAWSPAPCGGGRSRAPARRPCPPPLVAPPAAPDAWHAVRWTNSRQCPQTTQTVGLARRPAAAVRPGCSS
jgi:hypothetical protein